ncbi:3-methyladenine DNA glycosylase [Subtercola boreus]|uniref:3-methyladenine DNA glycosylase n=1 Tax=Subtercola boreus TaxID=120213 RepID=A0A3E0W1Y4_9MICO|nr:3-methyladenine DNA glycosylase [Subtercola boreus]RFA15097.1 3-methyladenine DNA glycosylase [Subtercola boreus]
MPSIATAVPPTGRTEATLLDRDAWTALESDHQRRADALSAAWRARRQTGEAHPVDDFLFTYYPFRPSLLRRWHPGAGVVLDGTVGLDRHEWRWYSRGVGADQAIPVGASRVDARGFLETKSSTVAFIQNLLGHTAARPARFSCFGLHEWAMVYKVEADAVRHEALPLRLTAAQTDEVVEQNRITCSHFDAFRFFTPEARPANDRQLTRESQPQLEQPGCLHAGMDVYKWAIKLGPLVPGNVLLDSFELARDIRQLDMQASPYDVSAFGLEAVRIETAEGKKSYAAEQRRFAERSNALRRDIVDIIEHARLL